MTAFCGKYVVLMELLYRDRELNQWCRDYSSYAENTTHCELRDLIYDGFMKAAYELEFMPKALAWKPYTLDFIKAQGHHIRERKPGAMTSGLDTSLHKWWLWIQLDEDRQWFLTVFVFEDGSVDKYSLNRETASDDHYEFKAEAEIRNQLYASGDENRYLHEILIRFVKEHGGEALLNLIMPYVTAQFHYD